jgi:lactoylglutathione lyase
MISNVSKVVVPVEDPQAARQFWTTTMGLTAVRDDTYADERWIEVQPPHQNLLLVLIFNCADRQQTHAELSRRGVRFPLPPSRQHFGWWALFEDNEGTRYALGQWDDRAPTPEPR